MNETAITTETLNQQIFIIRGQKVMLDFHLAEMYEVETKRLNEAVKRNSERFPEDFMFQLTGDEYQELMSQSVISSLENNNRSQFATGSDDPNLRSQIATSSLDKQHGGTRYLPYAFTEQGIAMLSGVLRSQRAIEVNISIMRAFVQMRYSMMSYSELSEKIFKMEQKYDGQFRAVFDALRALMEMPEPEPQKPNKIGYIHHKDKK